MLRKLVVGRFVVPSDVTGESNYAEIAGTGTLGKLLNEIVLPKGMASRRGPVTRWNRIFQGFSKAA